MSGRDNPFEQLNGVRYEDYNITYLDKHPLFLNDYTRAETVVEPNPVWHFDGLQRYPTGGVKVRVGLLFDNN